MTAALAKKIEPPTPLRGDQIQSSEHWTGPDLCLIWEVTNGEFKAGPQVPAHWNAVHASRYTNGGAGLQRGQTIKVFSREDNGLIAVVFVAGIAGTPQTGLGYLNLAEAWTRSGAPEPMAEQTVQAKHRFRFAG